MHRLADAVGVFVPAVLRRLRRCQTWIELADDRPVHESRLSKLANARKRFFKRWSAHDARPGAARREHERQSPRARCRLRYARWIDARG